MPRTREYDERRVLQAAMGVFWQQGYASASVKELEVATGLKPGSLYHAYGNKHGLFLAALDHYIDTVIAGRVRAYLREDGDPIDNLRTFIVTAFEGVGQQATNNACLLVNTAIEMGATDEEVHARLSRGFRILQRGFVQQTQRGQQSGQICSTHDPATLARQLGVTFQGLLVSSRLARRKAPLIAVTDAALAALR